MEYSRPNRSDVHLSKEEEDKIEETTRHYFDGIAPKRHTKPQRSEYSAAYSDDNNNDGGIIPESLEFQRLENENQILIRDGEGKVSEEFTETEYYKNLNGIDHQHHTTGTGFIKVDNNTDDGKRFSIIDTEAAAADDHHVSSKGNPATNDWIPAPNHSVDYFTDKPNRSDN